MEERIKTRFHEGILAEARRLFRIAPQKLRPLGGFESFIYAFDRDDGAFILRLGHTLRRTVPQVMGEVDWLHYLAQGGASVATPVRSQNERHAEVIDDGLGEQFVAVAFTRAPGRSPRGSEWKPELVEQYGALLGRIHSLSQTCEPSDSAWRRIEWNDPTMLFAELWLPASDAAILDRYQALLAHLDSLPKDDASYGLFHQDAHAGNLHVDDAGNITLFDFDDSCYSWYANDIAFVLFYAALWEADQAAFTAWFMRHFLKGYTQHSRLDRAWLPEMPHFLKLREIDLYAVIYRSFDLATEFSLDHRLHERSQGTPRGRTAHDRLRFLIACALPGNWSGGPSTRLTPGNRNT